MFNIDPNILEALYVYGIIGGFVAFYFGVAGIFEPGSVSADQVPVPDDVRSHVLNSIKWVK